MSSRFLARNALAGARVTLPRQATHLTQRRLASSEAMGDELVHERQHHKEHAGKSAELWRKVSLYVCVPGSLVLGYYIYGIESEHIHHRDHEIEENGGELPETTKYEYNDIRKKPFPWATEGQNNSFFFNPKANRNVEL